MRLKIEGTTRSVRVFADLGGDWVEVLHRPLGKSFELVVTSADVERLLRDFEFLTETEKAVEAEAATVAEDEDADDE